MQVVTHVGKAAGMAAQLPAPRQQVTTGLCLMSQPEPLERSRSLSAPSVNCYVHGCPTASLKRASISPEKAFIIPKQGPS